MDVDKMFKLPALPASGMKRKMPNAPTPEMLKKYKPNEDEPQHTSVSIPTNGGGRAATVSEVDEEDEDAGERRERSRGDDEGEDDEEGRFFGGGLNSEQNQILDIFELAGDGEEATALSVPALRRQLGKFERIVAKNAEQRGKFPDDPSKFIESESDLDGALKQFLVLTQNPAMYYPELVKQGTASLLASLLSHENTDIAVDVIEIIQELTDEDVGAGGDELDGDEVDEEDEQKAMQVRKVIAELIDELLNNSILDLLVANLGRLNESEDTDSRGVHNVLGVFENLLSFMPPLADTVVAETTLLPWLLKRISTKDFDSNKQYAAEILSILLQQSTANVTKMLELDGIDQLLGPLSRYRSKDPSDSEELEFVEDCFNCLWTTLAEAAGKKAFFDLEGVELMILMMKPKMVVRTRAIKTIDYALQTEDGAPACVRFVEGLGLKPLFSAFMGKGEGKTKKLNATSPFEDEEHVLSILSSLFTHLASDTPERIRLIAKFVENEYEKVERLLELREVAENRLKPVEKDIAREKKVMEANGEEVDEDVEAEWYLRRSESGLSALQAADYVLAWVCMEDDGALAHAKLMLGRKDQTLASVVAVLEDFAQNIGDDSEEDEEAEMPLQKMVIGQLVNYLSESI